MRTPDGDTGEAYWFYVRRGEILVQQGEGGVSIPVAVESLLDDPVVHVLGHLEGRWAFGVDVPLDLDGAPPGHDWAPLRQLYGKVPELHWTVAGRADQLVNWGRTHRFCGRCGARTEPSPAERSFRCPECDLLSYPRLSPATITIVTRGEHDEEVLLAHGRQFPGRFYSALAGFVEPGESLEECVVREIKEEVGIDVIDVRYFGSQPWPFPHSLMIGFRARYAGGDLALQEEEIVDAGWFRADDLPPSPRGGMSIAGWLIEAWLEEQAARSG